jgi:hypothetical protein
MLRLLLEAGTEAKKLSTGAANDNRRREAAQEILDIVCIALGIDMQ